MLSELQQNLNYVDGHRQKRQIAADFVLNNSDYLTELIQIGFDSNNNISHKACWVLEFVAYQKLHWLTPHLNFIIENLNNLNNDSAIRPMAKVMQLLITSHYKKAAIILTEPQLQKCIEVHFDWLITDTKVATKAYSIRTLYILGKHFDWIHPELKQIITKDYADHSAAYKAVAREILKKLK